MKERALMPHFLYLLPLLHCFLIASSLSLSHDSDVKPLKVGEELKGETLPLNSGQRAYELIGLRRSVSYEVKMSYPASIPASFSIQLQTTVPELSSRKNRRLLNTEKLIFKADNYESVFVILTVEAEGIVAKLNVPERELVFYNIVCNELMLGIPHDAWWVGVAALFCLLLGMVLPKFLPPHLLMRSEGFESENIAMTKES